MQIFSSFGVFIVPFWSIGVSVFYDDAEVIQILRTQTVHVRLCVSAHLFSFVFKTRKEFGVCWCSFWRLSTLVKVIANIAKKIKVLIKNKKIDVSVWVAKRNVLTIS